MPNLRTFFVLHPCNIHTILGFCGENKMAHSVWKMNVYRNKSAPQSCIDTHQYSRRENIRKHVNMCMYVYIRCLCMRMQMLTHDCGDIFCLRMNVNDACNKLVPTRCCICLYVWNVRNHPSEHASSNLRPWSKTPGQIFLFMSARWHCVCMHACVRVHACMLACFFFLDRCYHIYIYIYIYMSCVRV